MGLGIQLVTVVWEWTTEVEVRVGGVRKVDRDTVLLDSLFRGYQEGVSESVEGTEGRRVV